MTTVGPRAFTRVLAVYDHDSNGFGGPTDMTGPEIGQVSYVQNSVGDLALRIEVEFGQPNAKYTVFLVCGASHDLGCGFTVIDTLVTDAMGSGNTSPTVSIATLEAPPFGPGFRTDHIDLIQSDSPDSILTAGAINYFICKREDIPTPQEKEREIATSGKGDPARAQEESAGTARDPASTGAGSQVHPEPR